MEATGEQATGRRCAHHNQVGRDDSERPPGDSSRAERPAKRDQNRRAAGRGDFGSGSRRIASSPVATCRPSARASWCAAAPYSASATAPGRRPTRRRQRDSRAATMGGRRRAALMPQRTPKRLPAPGSPCPTPWRGRRLPARRPDLLRPLSQQLFDRGGTHMITGGPPSRGRAPHRTPARLPQRRTPPPPLAARLLPRACAAP